MGATARLQGLACGIPAEDFPRVTLRSSVPDADSQALLMLSLL